MLHRASPLPAALMAAAQHEYKVLGTAPTNDVESVELSRDTNISVGPTDMMGLQDTL